MTTDPRFPGANIIPIHGKTPKIHESAFIAPGCTMIVYAIDRKSWQRV